MELVISSEYCVYIVYYMKMARSADKCHNEDQILKTMKIVVTSGLFQYNLYVITMGCFRIRD
jgi:hypothetical protein